MRITNSMLVGNFLSDMRVNLNNLNDLQSQLTTGKKFSKPSDNPFGVSRSMQLHRDIDVNLQYNSNIKDTMNWLDTTDTALKQGTDVLQRIRELLVSCGNASYGSGERKAIKDEINQKISQFGQILNTNFDGKYIFGGNRVTEKPIKVNNPTSTKVIKDPMNKSTADIKGIFTGSEGGDYKISFEKDTAGKISKLNVEKTKADGTKVTKAIDVKPSKGETEPFSADLGEGLTFKYDGKSSIGNLSADYKFKVEVAQNNGNASLEYNLSKDNAANEQNMLGSKQNVEISSGVLMEYNVTIKDITEFTTVKDGTPESKDLMNLFKDIVNNLDSEEGTSKLTGENLNDMTKAIDNVLRVRSEVGAKQNSMDASKSINEDQKFNMQEILSTTEDIDFTETMMQMVTMQTIYTASLQTSARVMQPSLLDYLR